MQHVNFLNDFQLILFVRTVGAFECTGVFFVERANGLALLFYLNKNALWHLQGTDYSFSYHSYLKIVHRETHIQRLEYIYTAAFSLPNLKNWVLHNIYFSVLCIYTYIHTYDWFSIHPTSIHKNVYHLHLMVKEKQM